MAAEITQIVELNLDQEAAAWSDKAHMKDTSLFQTSASSLKVASTCAHSITAQGEVYIDMQLIRKL